MEEAVLLAEQAVLRATNCPRSVLIAGMKTSYLLWRQKGYFHPFPPAWVTFLPFQFTLPCC